MRSPSCEIIDRPLAGTLRHPLRFFSWHPLPAPCLAGAVLLVHEWLPDSDAPLVHVYAVGEIPDESGPALIVYGLVRVDPPAEPDREDGADASERIYRAVIPLDPASPARCDCRGWRLFRRCRHLESLLSVHGPPPKISGDALSDSDLESWYL